MFDALAFAVIVVFAFIVRHVFPMDSAYAPTFLLGFLLIAAYFGGLILARIRLPKISGYIISGLLFGPFVLGIVSDGDIEKLRLFDNLALGLIAVMAGGELHLHSLVRRVKSISLIILVQFLLLFLGITAVIFVFKEVFSLTAGREPLLALLIAMMFGVIAVATSPASTIAIISEYKARGPMTDIVLSVTVAKDVLVITAFAALLSLGRALNSDTQAFDVHFLSEIVIDVGFSVVLGIVVGLLVIWYLKFVKTDSTVFLLLLVFVVTEFAPRLHLDALMLCITAGFVVQNFSSQGEHLMGSIHRSVLPVFVLFFSVAGTSLQLTAFQETIALALLIIVARIFLLMVSTSAAARLAGEDRRVRKFSWMGFVAHAGVTLGLAVLVEKNFPEWGVQFKTVAVSIIAINQIVGPIFFRYGLYLARETAEFHTSEFVEGKTS